MHGKKLIGLILGIAVAMLILGMVIFFVLGARTVQDDVQTIQEAMTEVLVAKSVGDEIMSRYISASLGIAAVSTPPSTMRQVADRSRLAWERLADLEPHPRLKGYHSSVEGWALDVWLAADVAAFDPSTSEAKQAWRALPSTPPIFTTDLEEADAVKALETSVEEIVSAKEVGNKAIANNDREAMRPAAASLQTQNYWWQHQTYYEEEVCPRPEGCYAQMPTILPEMSDAAWDYVAEEPGAEEQWSMVWTQADLVIGGGGQIIEGAGITVGPPDIYTYPADVQTFFDECTAKGGIVGGTGGVKARLPTTESGYTCWYDDNKKCWDFLTYSKERYMGGNRGCPEQGLVPEQPQVPAVLDGFDGFYQGSETATCSGAGVGPITATEPISFTVEGNQIVDPSGTVGNIDIDRSGNLNWTWSFPYTTVEVSAKFSKDRLTGSTSVAGNITSLTSVDVEGVSFQVSCSGSFTASRVPQ